MCVSVKRGSTVVGKPNKTPEAARLRLFSQ